MSKNNIENQDVIIINNTYAGRYGQNKDNLPHEMINFFRADDDPNNEDNNPGFYIYITPAGIINNKIKKEHIKGIIFIRNVGDGLVEVLGKAELDNNSEFYTQGISSSKENQIAKVDNSTKKVDETKERLQVINKTIKYGSKELSEIHKGDDGILVSMKVGKICLPKKTFYLTHKAQNKELLNDIYFLPAQDGKSDGKQIANESMLAYYYSTDNSISYNKLKDILSADNELWKNKDETPQYDSKDIDNEIIKNNNFFKITLQQDNEVMFSNMLFYYFSNYPDLLKYFVKNQFSIDLTDNYIVEREKERMDIRIIDDKYYIIIENKIKSSINGIKKKSNKKNDEKNKNKPKVKYDYDDKGFAIDKEKKYISQLSDYLEKAEKTKGNRKIQAYILAPDYSSINKNLLSEKYSRGNEYEIFHYSDVKDKFLKYNGVKPPYYDDFLSALNKHTKSIDDEHRLDLLYRLKCRIEKIK